MLIKSTVYSYMSANQRVAAECTYFYSQHGVSISGGSHNRDSGLYGSPSAHELDSRGSFRTWYAITSSCVSEARRLAKSISAEAELTNFNLERPPESSKQQMSSTRSLLNSKLDRSLTRSSTRSLTAESQYLTEGSKLRDSLIIVLILITLYKFKNEDWWFWWMDE